nr:PQQ-like beta-propeller repeat protein [Sediminimonas sp.]
MKRTVAIMALAGLVALSGCERDSYLPGKREDLRASGNEDQPAARAQDRSAPISLPAQVQNSEWTHTIGTPRTRVSHAALRAAPQPVWSTPIGQGDTRRQRITADPVVAGGRVFTLDAAAKVTATSTEGQTLWSREVTPPAARSKDATGGGLAYGAGKLFVSSGFGQLTALAPDSGKVLWQQRLRATGSGAPTVYGGMVYLVAGDDTGWAIDAETGRVQWQVTAMPDVSNVLGAPAPALNDTYAIFAFGGGEVQATFRKGGLRAWNGSVRGQRRFSAASKVGDITGDPVIDGSRVYVGSHAGRVVAMNVANGERIWTAQQGAMNPVFPVGGSIFVISDRNELVRLDARDGSRIWGVELPGFTKSRPRRQVERVPHYGPILAGGRIVVASGDGKLRFFDPESGKLSYSAAVPGGATTDPVVAGGTLYVVGSRGQLHAFR